MIPRVLSIAGTDPTGGAGIQADLKSIAAMGGFGMAAVTALVAQNTQGVRSVHAPPASFLDAQLRAVSDDVRIDAVKVGMLQSVDLIDTVGAWLDDVDPPIVVLDTVMVATSGDRLLERDAEDALRTLCRRAHLVTPNLPELAVLTRQPIASTWEVARAQAAMLHDDTGATVLLKGGHLDGERCPDAIVGAGEVREVHGRRVHTRNTHGTGCSLSSAMATLAATGLDWEQALRRAKIWLEGALEHADDLHVGHGNGPIDHFHERRASMWSTAAWRASAKTRRQVDEGRFVTGLIDGTLAGDDFRWYLAQDVLYLEEYSRLLARAGDLSPDDNARRFWARGSAAALEEAEHLHRTRIGADRAQPSTTTRAYLDHLRGSSGSYPELVAALLPCYWMYADIGRRMPRIPAAHPYADWLTTYADPAFAAATSRAIALADAAAAAASGPDRQRMDAAFAQSARHERDFFDAAFMR